jgi:outer membrane receptor protein involved in Fe transport
MNRTDRTGRTGRTLTAMPRPVALAAALSLLPALALAQATAPKDANDTLDLNRIVVTGTTGSASKMKQSVSISTLESDQILKLSPTNAAEVLRSIPGIRSESSGGEGNANLTVRGLPISAGGARYVQFQEDGLPILLFGDIAFGTADQFLRTDYSLSHLEVIRGGSASTLASNSPGGIINFISKTGDEPGGAVGLTLGLDGGRQTRVDANYGFQLGNGTRLHIGGFQRVGEGDRETGFNAAKGGQVKASITQDFKDGFVRATVKVLDDRTPSFLPVPVITTNGQIHTIPGIDPRSAFFINKSTPQDMFLSAGGSMVSTNPRDGLRVKSTAFGLEGQLRLADGWTLSDKFRTADNSGRFMALFPSDNGLPAAGGSTFTGVLFNTAINSLDNTFNDLKVSKAFGMAGGKATVNAGLFTGKQDVALTWFWNRYTVDMKNLGAGATLAGTGFSTFPAPGTTDSCCVRNFDVSYTTTAPYASLNWEAGPLTLDMSLRRDQQKAKGFAQIDDLATKTWNLAGQQKVDYKLSRTSYSAGGNYQFTKDLAGFARISNGVAFSADRLLYGNPLDGSVPVAINEVKQIEGGAKWRAGGFSLFATLFEARTAESNYEATTQTFTANKYKANGVELEMGYKLGDFKLTGGGTYTKAKITASNDASTVGKRPRRQAEFVYQLSPSYSIGPVEVGAAVIGTSKSWGNDANTITQPGYTVLNAFVNYQVNDRLGVSLSANNLGNTLGYTEVEGDGHAARSINGRTVKATLKYSF